MLLVCGGLALTACGKKDKDDGAGSTSTAAATASATASAAATAAATTTASAAPADTASAAPSGDPSAAPAADTAAPAAVNNTAPQRPIDDCCAALSARSHTSGRGKAAKNKAHKAAEVCPGIAALVRQGRATRAQALTQIRSALVGSDVPAACH
ncbi:Hypothetical protein A7982_08268 [Minicystis rosea]|nr:Hypothetical protein A7982_08268 [Minicystis rosea]